MGKVGKAKAKAKEKTIEQQLKYVGPTDPKIAARQSAWTRLAFFLTLSLDFCFAVALYHTIHGKFLDPSLLKPSGFISSLTHFRSDSLDLILLALLRTACLVTLSFVAGSSAHKEGHELVIKPTKGSDKKIKGTGGASDLTAPLLANGEGGGDGLGGEEHENEEEERERLLREEEEKKHEVIKWKKEEVDPGFAEWLASVSPKDVTLFFSFLLCTAFQVYSGAKCVSFDFSNEMLQGTLMGSTVLWINAESTLMGYVAEAEGVLGRAIALTEKASAAASHAASHMHGTSGTPPRRTTPVGTPPRGSPLPASATAAGASTPAAAGAGSPLLTTITVDGGEKRGGVRESAVPVGGGEVVVVSTGQRGRRSTDHSSATREDQVRGDRGVREEKVLTPRAYLLRAISLARSELPLLIVGFSCLGVTSAAGLLIPHYQGRIIDDVKDLVPDVSRFHRDVLYMAMYSLVTGVFGGLRGLCFSIVGKRVLRHLQDKLFHGVIIQDIAYFDATTTGELTSRLTNDVAAMSEPINWQLSALMRNMVALIGGILLCFLTSWKLSILAFTTMAPILHITAVYSRWSRDLNRSRYAVLAEANSAASEALGNIRTVRAFSTEDVEMERYRSKIGAAMTKGVRDAVAYSGAVAINNWLDLGASVLILWYGGVLVMDGRMTVGSLITFQLYWNLIQGGYQSIMSVLTSLTKASGAAQRVLSLVDALPDIDPNSGTVMSSLRGSIKMEDVHFHYQMRPDHPVLRGVSLSVDAGQVCALVGRSGGGKSTIVHLLMRFYDPTAGRVLVDGQDMRSLNLKSLHLQMGVVAQDTQMWACSIEENIAYGLPEYTRAEVEQAAKSANAHDFIVNFPEGYATRVGERGVRLSGGQRQRIAIARMLLRKPRVLLLDEATSALDAESEAAVQSALDRLISEGGRTIILVAHRLSTVRNADAICVMDSGKIVEHGTHEELLTIPNGVYERLVRRQLSKAANVIGSGEGVSAAAAADKHDRIDALIEDH